MPRTSDPNAKIKLLSAAEQEFVEHGLDRAKIEGITARAGLSKGAFYLHFESKETAFLQLVETTLARLAARLDALPKLAEINARSTDVEGFLATWLEQDLETFEFVWQNRGVMRLLLDGGSSVDFRYLMDEFAERTRDAVVECLEFGKRLGLYRRDLDCALTGCFMAGAYDRVARQIVQDAKKPDLHATLKALQALILRGIASDGLLARITDSQVKKTDTARPADVSSKRPARTDGRKAAHAEPRGLPRARGVRTPSR